MPEQRFLQLNLIFISNILVEKQFTVMDFPIFLLPKHIPNIYLLGSSVRADYVCI